MNCFMVIFFGFQGFYVFESLISIVIGHEKFSMVRLGFK